VDSDARRITTEYGRLSGTITTRSLDIRTLDEALDAAGVDRDAWEVERHVINYWEVTGGDETKTLTNVQVKVWLKRRVTPFAERALGHLIESLETASPPYVPRPIARPRDECALFLGLYDHHLGKLAWKPETGEAYDTKRARALYVDAAADLLAKSRPFGVGRVVLPLGQDFFHLNDPTGSTPQAGNPLDVDGRLAKVFAAGEESVVRAVELCAAVAPVDVVWVPGNHDPQTSYYLARVIRAYFREADHVTVDTGPAPRKYVRHGVCLLGLTHGSEEPHRDLPVIMAAEAPGLWAETTHREWLTGHKHKRKETRYIPHDTFNGVGVRILPSLCATDEWHYRKGYVGNNRAADAYLWHASEGYVGHFATYAP
jgi:hypothetical protein